MPAVLVVDDEDQLRRLITRLLERSGYRVRTVSDGNEAIAQLGKDPFDTVVLDASIVPHGAEAVMRQIEKLDPRPGLVVTGGDEPEPQLIALLPDFDACFLRKPFAPERLRSEVALRCAYAAPDPTQTKA